MNNANTVVTPSWLKWMYRITTGLLIAWMLSSGIMALSRAAPIVEAISRLGYPNYFALLLGLAKTGGAILLLLPIPRGLRSWVYAGATFELLSAAFSYAASGAGVAEVAVPLGFLALVHGSFWSWRGQRSRVETSQPGRRATAFDRRKVQDQGFVKVYRALEVTQKNLSSLAERIQGGDIRRDQDVFLVGEPGQQRIAVTLWNLAYHHLAQGWLSKHEPFLISFCPVCSSGMVFDPRVDDRVLTFRVGGVYRGTMIMCDAQTGSFWDHMTGKCLGGVHEGKQLRLRHSHDIQPAGQAVDRDPTLLVAVPKLSWFERFMTRFQNGHTWRSKPEGKFYPGFRASFVFEDSRRPEKELGLGVWLEDAARFYPLEVLKRQTSFSDTLGEANVELSYDRDFGVPRADRTNGGPNVNFVFTRWYGFAQTFPGCEIYSTEAEAHRVSA
ncbi:MAG: DUF3179 domain-containing (seleno)protein [Myxococcota bacterium]